jgi:hypothetical protein
MIHNPPLCSTHILYNNKNEKSSTFSKKIKKILKNQKIATKKGKTLPFLLGLC